MPLPLGDRGGGSSVTMGLLRNQRTKTQLTKDAVPEMRHSQELVLRRQGDKGQNNYKMQKKRQEETWRQHDG